MQPSGTVVPGLRPPLSSLLPPLLCFTDPGPTGPPRGTKASWHPQLSCFLHLCLWLQRRDHPPHCPLASLQASAAVSGLIYVQAALGTADWTPVTGHRVLPAQEQTSPQASRAQVRTALTVLTARRPPLRARSLAIHSFIHPLVHSSILSRICSSRDNATYVHFMLLPQ